MKKSNKKWMMGITSLAFVALMMVNFNMSIESSGMTPELSIDKIEFMANANAEDPWPGGSGTSKNCAYSGTFSPSDSYTHCEHCGSIHGVRAIQIFTCSGGCPSCPF